MLVGQVAVPGGLVVAFARRVDDAILLVQDELVVDHALDQREHRGVHRHLDEGGVDGERQADAVVLVAGPEAPDPEGLHIALADRVEEPCHAADLGLRIAGIEHTVAERLQLFDGVRQARRHRALAPYTVGRDAWVAGGHRVSERASGSRRARW